MALQSTPAAAPADGNSVVRVRAQVMMRDDSTGGWVPMGGGGLSNVSVRKRKIQHDDDQPCKHEYLIHGKRISDQSVVLSCTIKKDFEYNKVMPTFHHWKTGNKKFGLTFQTAADARAFDKGVKLAIEDLLDAKSLACPHKHCRESKKKGISESSPLHQYNMDVGDDDVFMQLDLPVDKSDGSRRSISPPNATSPNGGGRTPSPLLSSTSDVKSAPSGTVVGGSAGMLVFPPVRAKSQVVDWTAVTHERKPLLATTSTQEDPKKDKEYSYVKFPPRPPPAHDYSYPKLVDALAASAGEKEGNGRRDSITSIKKSLKGKISGGSPPSAAVGSGSPPLALGEKSKRFVSSARQEAGAFATAASSGIGGSGNGGEGSPGSGGSGRGSAGGGSRASSSAASKATCVHCRESFSPSANPRGACDEAPDCARAGLEAVTCLQCAKCLLYHCMSDSEGDYVHPCDCSNADGHRARRWIGLVLLSVLVPCLCCYAPLMACYRCGGACGVCGGRHQAS